MADMSKISPDAGQTIYNLKDAYARVNKWDKSSQKVAGAYNFFNVTAVSSVVSPLTITINADKSVRVAASSATSKYIPFILAQKGDIVLPKGTYKLVGGPGRASTKIRLVISVTDEGTTTAYYDDGNGVEFTVTGDTAICSGQLAIESGYNSDLTISPIITPDLLATSADYVPYRMSNKELTDAVYNNAKITYLRLSLNFNDGGCNLLKSSYPNVKYFIPSAMDATGVIYVALANVDGTYFRFLARTIAGSWATGTYNVNCIAILI